jgi:hypothetical protein
MAIGQRIDGDREATACSGDIIPGGQAYW